MVDVSRECCERYFGMDDELFDYTMATLRWLLALCVACRLKSFAECGYLDNT